MMMMKDICFTLLSIFIPLSRSLDCQIRISRNETKDVCCADFERRDNDCIVYSKGYTSLMGKTCKPCSNNTYGERCKFDCICSDFEVCNNVKGCVKLSPTTGSSVYATSDSFIPILTEKFCERKTVSGQREKICCADYEERGNGCIACSTGYTSNMGRNCKPCLKNTYGERCRYSCSRSGIEICNHVDGCVVSSSTKRDDTTSYNRTYISTKRTATHSVNNITSSYREENTNKQCIGCSQQGLLFREVIVYSALSVVVSGFGICLCFVSLKYKTLTKKYIVTFSQTRNTSILQQIQTVEIADRLYEIINEEDLLDDRRIQQIQKEMSSEYLDVIQDSNTRKSCESKSIDNQGNPCKLLSIIQTQNQEHNLKVDNRSLMSGDSTSSSNEYQWDSTQDYLNPYQPMIDISPPAERKYLTIATAHNNGDGNNKDSTVVRNAYELQHPREMKKDAMNIFKTSIKVLLLA